MEESSHHKSERTDAASASLYSYPRDSNLRAAYKKLHFFCIKHFLVRTLSYFQKYFKLMFRPWKHEKTALKSCSEFIIGLFLGSFFRTADTAENWFSILEIRLRHPLFFLLCGCILEFLKKLHWFFQILDSPSTLKCGFLKK